MLLAVAALWLCTQRLSCDTRAPLTPPLRLVCIDRSHLSLARARC